MCMFSTPTPAAPQLPPETAAMKQPDNAAIRTAQGRRTTDRVRSMTPTILTSGTGVKNAAATSRPNMASTVLTDEPDQLTTILG